MNRRPLIFLVASGALALLVTVLLYTSGRTPPIAAVSTIAGGVEPSTTRTVELSGESEPGVARTPSTTSVPRVERFAEPVPRISGRVVHRSRAGVPAATVFLGPDRTQTDERGAFMFVPKPDARAAPIVAWKSGWLPAAIPCRAASPLGEGAWPEPLVVVLGEEALIIRGQVVDRRGNGIAAARVRLIDPPTLDELLGVASAALLSDDSGLVRFFAGAEAVSQPDGRFGISNLVARAYRLEALDPKTLAIAETEPIEAGRADVRIELATDDVFPCLAGRLVDLAGVPVAGLRVQPCRQTRQGTVVGAETRSDPDGRFRLAGVSRKADSLAVLFDRAAARMFRIADHADPCSLVLVVPQLADILFELVTPGLDADSFALLTEGGQRVKMAKPWQPGADSFNLLDENGQRVRLPKFGNSGWVGPYDRLPFEGGKSNWVIVPEDTATIVLYKGEREVARRPVGARPGERTVVRL